MKKVITTLLTLVLTSCSEEPGHLEMDRKHRTASFNEVEISYAEADLMLRETGSPKTSFKMSDGALEVDGTIEDHRPMAVMMHRMATLSLEEMTPADLEFRRKVEKFVEKKAAKTKLPVVKKQETDSKD